MKKFPLAFAPLVVAAFAVVSSSALGGTAQCRVLTFGTESGKFGKTCNNPPGVEKSQNLREAEDGAGTSPVSTDFPTTALLVNTKSELRYSTKIAAVELHNIIPLGYGLLGLKVESNPETSETVCRSATGSVPWADIQDASPTAVFDGTSSWPLTVVSNSSACKEAERGRVIIHEVSLLLETLGASKSPVIATGTLTGKYEQPGANCPAGGIKLQAKQSGITTEPEAEAGTFEIDNGTTGEAAYLCFVSANNYVFPKEAPKWSLKEGEGIWSDAPAINWKVNGKFLKVGEQKDSAGSGTDHFDWKNDKGETVISVCKYTYTEKLKSDGTDERIYLTYECEYTAPASYAGKKYFPSQANEPTALKERAGKFFDLATGISVAVQVFNSKGEAIGEEDISGDSEGEWDNATTELVYPEAALEGSTLRTSGGDQVTAYGSDKLELEGGGTLEVDEE